MSQKNGKVVVCIVCKKKFYVPKCRLHVSKYCSHRCHGLNMKGKAPWNKGKHNIYSEEALKKMSKNRKGSPSSFKGKHHSEKTKQQISIAKMGTPSWNKNIPCKEITKKRLSNALKGKYRGNQRYNWKGGRIVGSDGYVLIRHYTHPYRNASNNVREHRLVMEQYLSRYLKPTERVHHINGIKTDNCIENLKLFSNESKHQKYHNRHKR